MKAVSEDQLEAQVEKAVVRFWEELRDPFWKKKPNRRAGLMIALVRVSDITTSLQVEREWGVKWQDQ